MNLVFIITDEDLLTGKRTVKMSIKKPWKTENYSNIWDKNVLKFQAPFNCNNDIDINVLLKKKMYDVCLAIIHARRYRVDLSGWSHQEGFHEGGMLCLRCVEEQEMLRSRRQWRWMVRGMEVHRGEQHVHLGRTKPDPYKDWTNVSVGWVQKLGQRHHVGNPFQHWSITGYAYASFYNLPILRFLA